MNPKTKSFLGALFIIFLFIISSYFARQNAEFLKNLIGNDFIGVLFYILITIIAVVIAPISMMPLIPIASSIFGWFYAAIFNIVGWTIGSFIVFLICRKLGIPLIRRFVSLEKLYKFESRVPEKNFFVSVVLLRMAVPVDILSYALSIFTKIDFKTYALATIIGIMPFAFVWSYLGTVPVIYQITGITIVSIIVAIILEFSGMNKK